MTNLEYMMQPCCPEVFKDIIFTFIRNTCCVCEYISDYSKCIDSSCSCQKGLNHFLESEFDEDFWDDLPLISMEGYR